MTELSAGRLLVATPALGDPNFARAVVLLLDHDEEGSLGVVLNHPTPVEVGDVLPTWQGYTEVPGVVFRGGPVALDSALGLGQVAADGSDPEAEEPMGWRRVTGPLGLVDLDAPPELLVAEMAGVRIFAGYAGWGAGQLEEEVGEGAWFVVDQMPGDIFSAEPESLWRRVLRRQPGELAFLSTFPADPTHN